MDVLVVDWLFDDFPGAERNISAGIEISGSLVQGSVDSLPSFDFAQLDRIKKVDTIEFLSCSPTLTILPKEGITLMLMLLKGINLKVTRRGRCCFGMTLSFRSKKYYNQISSVPINTHKININTQFLMLILTLLLPKII